ncbi:hypothetical protein [Aliiglaciecola litoralis]|uniref:Uncharacterized protein n=1 Tax=Aliiglaciecola litoralis TaxID=582857 RepID=A0ABP3WRI9_9ALTE
MLILSLIFISLVVLLIFSLIKDTGEHTVYARKNAFRDNTVRLSDAKRSDIDSSEPISAN